MIFAATVSFPAPEGPERMINGSLFGVMKLFFRSSKFFDYIGRKSNEIDEKPKKKLKNSLSRIKRSEGDAAEIDDDIFPEFALLELFDPWKAIREVGLRIDSVFDRWIETRKLESELFDIIFRELALEKSGLLDEIEDGLERLIRYFHGVELLFFLEFVSESFETSSDLDSREQMIDILFRELLTHAFEGIKESILDILLLFFLEDPSSIRGLERFFARINIFFKLGHT